MKVVLGVGHAIAQAANHWFLITEIQLHFWVTGGQSGTRTDLSQSSLVTPANHHSIIAAYSFITEVCSPD